MKYICGEWVKIRGDLKPGNLYGGIIFTTEMEKHKSRVERIFAIKKDYYRLDVCPDKQWSEEMFEPVFPIKRNIHDFEVGTRVYLLSNGSMGTVFKKKWHAQKQRHLDRILIRWDDGMQGTFAPDDKTISILKEKGKDPEHFFDGMKSEILGNEMIKHTWARPWRPEDQKEIKLEKPKNELEKQALIDAKEDAIEKAIKAKKEEYEKCMDIFIDAETNARAFREKADEYAKILGITAEDKKKLF